MTHSFVVLRYGDSRSTTESRTLNHTRRTRTCFRPAGYLSRMNVLSSSVTYGALTRGSSSIARSIVTQTHNRPLVIRSGVT